jgi:hypothetical protein
MHGRKGSSVPADLAKARDRFTVWRRNKRPRSRIPQPLWKLAIMLAGRHGLHCTASVLRLDYYSLKKRIEQADGDRNVPAAFIEVAPASLGASAESLGGSSTSSSAPPEWTSASLGAGGECVIELEDGGGASMRVALKGHAMPDLAALIGSFWKAD